MLDYEIFHVVDKKIYGIILEPNEEHTVYIKRSFYDYELLCGQETCKKTRHQLEIDSPRSEFKIDGKVIKVVPFLKTVLARYCTQTVMAIPVQMLTHTGVVAECVYPHKMCVNIWGESVFIQKKLRIMRENDWIPIFININMNIHDPCVIVTIKSGDSNFEKCWSDMC